MLQIDHAGTEGGLTDGAAIERERTVSGNVGIDGQRGISCRVLRAEAGGGIKGVAEEAFGKIPHRGANAFLKGGTVGGKGGDATAFSAREFDQDGEQLAQKSTRIDFAGENLDSADDGDGINGIDGGIFGACGGFDAEGDKFALNARQEAIGLAVAVAFAGVFE